MLCKIAYFNASAGKTCVKYGFISFSGSLIEYKSIKLDRSIRQKGYNILKFGKLDKNPLPLEEIGLLSKYFNSNIWCNIKVSEMSHSDDPYKPNLKCPLNSPHVPIRTTWEEPGSDARDKYFFFRFLVEILFQGLVNVWTEEDVKSGLQLNKYWFRLKSKFERPD